MQPVRRPEGLSPEEIEEIKIKKQKKLKNRIKRLFEKT